MGPARPLGLLGARDARTFWRPIWPSPALAQLPTIITLVRSNIFIFQHTACRLERRAAFGAGGRGLPWTEGGSFVWAALVKWDRLHSDSVYVAGTSGNGHTLRP